MNKLLGLVACVGLVGSSGCSAYAHRATAGVLAGAAAVSTIAIVATPCPPDTGELFANFGCDIGHAGEGALAVTLAIGAFIALATTPDEEPAPKPAPAPATLQAALTAPLSSVVAP